jgi:hypothetical protein
LAKAAHPAYPLPANISRKHRAEPVPPQTHGFVTDIDAALEHSDQLIILEKGRVKAAGKWVDIMKTSD